MVTYKKIAEKAGVSESTVSKALSGSAEIAPATVEKIRTIACELGYYNAKRALRRVYAGSFSPHVAIICPEIVSVYYSTIAESLISKITSSSGQATVMISRFGKEESLQIAASIARNPDFDGIISLQSFYPTQELNIPTVFMCPVSGVEADSIYCESDMGVENLAEYLLSQGHRTLGFVGEEHTVYKEDAFRKALKRLGVKIREEYIFRTDKRFFDAGREAFKTFSENGKPLPDAVICAYDEIAFGFMSEAERAGVRVPENVSVAGINNTPFGEVSSPPLTSVSNWREEMVHKAYDLLVSRILGADLPYQSFCYENKIIERDSVKLKK